VNISTEENDSHIYSTTSGVVGWMCSLFGIVVDVVAGLGAIFLFDVGFNFQLALKLYYELWIYNLGTLNL